jgi:hypothetical protein
MPEIEKSISNNGLPDFKKNWMKLKDLVPGRFIQPSDWEEQLNVITVVWRDYGDKMTNHINTFTAALILPNVPKLEVSDASLYLDSTKESWNKFVAGMVGVAGGTKYKWEEVMEYASIAETIKEADYDKSIQAIALLQAISETHTEGRTPEGIRQRIAQHSFDEIVTLGAYRALDYSGTGSTVTRRTTQDYSGVEKDELTYALRHDMWNEERLKEKAKVKKQLRSIISSSNNNVDSDTADPLEKLWNAANGKGVTKKSALHYLQLAEDIYRELESGEAFDVNILEEPESEE